MIQFTEILNYLAKRKIIYNWVVLFSEKVAENMIFSCISIIDLGCDWLEMLYVFDT